MKRFRRPSSFRYLVPLLLLAGTASAQSAEGFAINRFDPSERGSDWFWAESLDLRGHNRWAVGVVGDWGYKPLVAYDANGDQVAALVEHQVYAHLGASVVFWDRLRLGLNVPVLAYQTGEDVTVQGVGYEAPSGAALGDVRLGADVRLFGVYGGPATLAVGAQVHIPTGSVDKYTSDGKARIVPRASLAGDIGIFTYAVKTGINVRLTDHDFANAPTGSEWFFGGAAGVRLLDKKLTIGPEVWASTVIRDTSRGFFKGATTPVEGILGAHYLVANEWKIGAGVGPGMTRGLGSPTLRTLVSIEWTPQPAEPVQVVDTDGDGIPDSQDACPTEPGVENADRSLHGCPLPQDTDGDGIPDDQDACPDVAGIESDDPAQHGCPLADSDGDGIPDVEDACPNEKGVQSSDPAKNGCPLPKDNDSDGIVNEEDACPDQAGPANKDPSKHGCPQAQIKDGQVKILDRIEFDTGKATLTSESIPILEAVLKVLNENPSIEKMRIEGHTDNRGAAWLNRDLSKRRAKTVLDWLVENGIAADRLESQGFGPDQPIDTNETEEGRQNNRRVEFKILKSSSENE